MARVLVLREAEDGRRTAELLRARGHEALLLPLQEIHALDPPMGSEPVGGFLATSAHAAPWLGRVAAGTGLPILAVGARTAEALRAAGLDNVTAGPGRAADLVPMARDFARPGALLVYAAGRVRLPDLENGLRDAGIPFRVVEVYDTVDRAPDEADLERLAAFGAPDAVLLLSRRQAELFMGLGKRHAAILPPTLRHLCLSEAIATRLGTGRRGEWPERPDLSALMDRLDAG